MEQAVDEVLQRAIGLHRKGDLQEAELLYRAILQSRPQHSDANHNLGVLAVSINKVETALPLFKAALDSNSKIEQYWLSYIDALIKEKKFDIAHQVIKRGMREGVDAKQLNFLKAQIYTNPLKERFEGKSPPKEKLNELLEYYQTKNYEDAEYLALSLTKEFPNHPFSWKIMGAIYGQSGRHSGSLNINRKCVELVPHDPETRSNLGNTLQELGSLEEAKISFKQAIILSTNFAEAYNNLGSTFQEQGKLKDALLSYKQAITLDFSFPEAHRNLGVVLSETGQLEEAEVSLLQAIFLRPRYAEAYNNLAITLTEMEKIEKAEIIFMQAIILAPNKFALAYDQLGVLQQRRKRFQSAELYLNKFLVLSPSQLPNTVSMGTILYNRGDLIGALELFDAYNNELSRARALEVLFALGRTEEIYERIEDQAHLKTENLGIAAIAAFLSERDNKQTANNFCNNPIDFVYIANVSSHIEDANLFLSSVIDELRDVRTSWEPIARTTKNGFQASVDIFKNPSTRMTMLQAILENELDSYRLNFQKEPCSLIKRWPKKNKLSGWHVILKQHGYQTAHIHPNGWVSGIIYLQVAPSLGGGEGAVEFSLNGPNYHYPGASKKIHQPKLGDIVLFPSSLHHRTIPFSTNMERICISFDLIP